MLGSRGPNMINKCVVLVLTYKVKYSQVNTSTTHQHEFYPYHYGVIKMALISFVTIGGKC